MSYHFYIPKKQEIQAGQLLQEVRKEKPRAELGEGYESDRALDQGVLFMVPGMSARGVFVTGDDDDYDVTTNTWSSRDDYALALVITRKISGLTGGNVTPEDREAMTLQEFTDDFGDEWIDQARHWGLRAIATMVQREQGTMTLFGCVREVHVGPDTVERLFVGEPDDETLYERCMDMVCRLQYFDPDETYIPSVMQVNATEDKHFTYVMWLAEAPELLLNSDYVLIHHDDDLNTLVPRDEIVNLMRDRSERLDEHQYLLPPVPEAEFVEIARKLMGRFGDARSAFAEASAKAAAEGETKTAEEQPPAAESPSAEAEESTEPPKKKKPKWKFW